MPTAATTPGRKTGSRTAATQDVNGLAGGPGSQRTDGGEAPAKNATDPATGGATTPDGSSSGPDDQPSRHPGSDPTEDAQLDGDHDHVADRLDAQLDAHRDAPTATPTSDTHGAADPDAQGPGAPGAALLQRRARRARSTPNASHLQPYDRKVDTKETTTLGGRLYALGSTYRWEDGARESGLQIRVASGWDQVDWLCGASYADWDCHVADHQTAPRPARRLRRSPPTTACARWRSSTPADRSWWSPPTRRTTCGRAAPARPPAPRPTWSPQLPTTG